jgi:predicted Fe-S protein YdhL (DUF1289 family)
MKHLRSAICACAFAAVATPALADLYSEMNMQPMTPELTVKLRAETRAAIGRWATMSAAEKSAVTQSMRSKRIGDLTATERVAQNNDMTAMTQVETAELRAQRQAAQVRYGAMTPAEKAAIRASAKQRRLADLDLIEQVGQNDDMGREFEF